MEGEGGEGGTTGNMICARANFRAHTTRASNNSTLRALAQTEAHLRSLKHNVLMKILEVLREI